MEHGGFHYSSMDLALDVHGVGCEPLTGEVHQDGPDGPAYLALAMTVTPIGAHVAPAALPPLVFSPEAVAALIAHLTVCAEIAGWGVRLRADIDQFVPYIRTHRATHPEMYPGIIRDGDE